ncbi:MAG: hypothetical protein M5U12_01760 [Verrucomicrobia bacterium]|nr:hypothetical protein [Verrucomicrobiota bacterium]
MPTRTASAGQVTAGIQRDSEGKPRRFTLTLGRETVSLDPGLPWIKADTYKWVTRGLIEQPQSFHVHADGTVEINGEKLSLDAPDATRRLETEINKHHDLPAPARTVPSQPAAVAPTPASPVADHVVFRVKLDRFGHLAIDCHAGEEHTSTSLRGLPSLIHNGLMLPPAQFHVDPLQRHVEIDGARFECSEAGARELEAAPQRPLRPRLADSSETPIEVRENPASPSGFDLRFVVTHAGARFEVKGHLDQEKLDILQDPAKSNLLKPGMLLRLVPPLLFVRRRRPDGGEERVPELPDFDYLRATAAQLKEFLNHPLLRRGAGPVPTAAPAPTARFAEVVALRVGRNPQNRVSLWLEAVTRQGEVVEGCALTHHNVAELQRRGLFQPHLDVTLALDHQTLMVLNQATHKAEKLVVNPQSPEEDLARASQMLTAALRPPLPGPPPSAEPLPEPGGAAPPGAVGLAGIRGADVRPSSPPPSVGSPPAPLPAVPPAPAAAAPPVAASPAATPLPPMPAAPPPAAREEVYPVPQAPATTEGATGDAGGAGVFPVADPATTLEQVFRTVAERSGLEVQDVRLSLPPAFIDRRFEVLAFTGQIIEAMQDLRAPDFAGFYLAHLGNGRVLLVYANQGRRVEFGVQRCELQISAAADPDEFHGPGLLGLAQDAEGTFVFVVRPEFRAWASGRERLFAGAAARFATPAEALAAAETLVWIWPSLEVEGPASKPERRVEDED